jgi:hypothetical protein
MSTELQRMEERILASLQKVKSEITNDTIASHEKLLKCMQEATERFDVLESKVTDIGNVQIQLQSKIKTLNEHVDDSTAHVAQDVDRKLRELRDAVQEERRKMIRLSNVVLFGVPETTAGIEIASKMMKVLLPDWTGNIDEDRIGSLDSAKPRPLRVKLDNYNQKRKALSSKRMLKTYPEFNGISVQRDMTKAEQKESKEKLKSKPNTSNPVSQLGPSSSGVKTRAGTKRRCSSELNENQSSKFGKPEETIDMD